MPLYHYQAIDVVGKKKSGFIEAIDEREAKSKLRDQGLMVSSLATKSSISTRQNLHGDNLLAFIMQLSQLINAGVPLYQSLVAIEEQYRNESYHRILLSLCDQIKAGRSLSEAFSIYPDSFNKLICSMVKAGESSGSLHIVLDKLSQLLAKQNKLRKQIATAMIYPSVLACFSLIIIGLLMGFVVPAIEGVFAGKQLNAFTTIVLAISHFLRSYWWIFIPSVIGGIYLLYSRIRSPKGKIWLQKNLLKVPIIRTLIIQTSVARFCRTMGTLQQGGLTMIDSLRLAKQVMGNVVLEEEIQKAENRIIEGSSLSAELTNSKLIPLMVSRMLAVGEESGSTLVMLNKIADIYEDDIEKTLDRLMALSQPIILIVMGAVIGTVLLAILLPMTDFSSFAMQK